MVYVYLNFLDNGINCTLGNNLCAWRISGGVWYFGFNKGRLIICDKLFSYFPIETRKRATRFNKTGSVFHFVIKKNSIWFLLSESIFTS